MDIDISFEQSVVPECSRYATEKRAVRPDKPEFLEPTIEASIRGRAPIWVLVICLLMGIFLCSELVAMISRGAPYTIPGRNLTPISQAEAPIEFFAFVTLYIFGGGGFIAAPIAQIVSRLRSIARRQL
jgi:hypothetical protein